MTTSRSFLSPSAIRIAAVWTVATAVLTAGGGAWAGEKAPIPFPPRADVPDERPLSPENARRLLEWDWLYQADGKATVGRSLAEVGWARELGERLARQSPKLDFAAELGELVELERKLQAKDGTSEEAKDLYFAVRRVKRRITLKNPVLDFNRFLVVERHDAPVFSYTTCVDAGGVTGTDLPGRTVIAGGFARSTVARVT